MYSAQMGPEQSEGKGVGEGQQMWRGQQEGEELMWRSQQESYAVQDWEIRRFERSA